MIDETDHENSTVRSQRRAHLAASGRKLKRKDYEMRASPTAGASSVGSRIG